MSLQNELTRAVDYLVQWRDMERGEAAALVARMASLVDAIRSSSLVGRTTCAIVNETMDTGGMILQMRDHSPPVKTPRQALEWAFWWEELGREQACEQRWGEDTDWQLQWMREWEAAADEREREIEGASTTPILEEDI